MLAEDTKIMPENWTGGRRVNMLHVSHSMAVLRSSWNLLQLEIHLSHRKHLILCIKKTMWLLTARPSKYLVNIYWLPLQKRSETIHPEIS